jgi:radical SAM-linked protein
MGMSRYVSHLDLMRAMTRTVRRANLPLWYTEGYNPHPYMTFLMPLPLGQSGMREPLDIKIEQDDITFKQIKERLNAVMPQGIEIVDVCKPEMKSNEIAAAEYRIITEFETRLIIDGTLNSPYDCKIPTAMYADAVKRIEGNKIRNNCAVCSTLPGTAA